MHNKICEYFSNSIEVKSDFRDFETESVYQVIQTIIECYNKGGKILIFGNGGSASDAQHFACELEGRFLFDRKPLQALCLNTNTSTLTAVGNDYGYEDVFSRQIIAYGKNNDIAIGISTSGNSKNVINAIQAAHENGLTTVALLGKDGGKLKKMVDHYILVESNDTPHVQETHITIIHCICKLVEEALFV